MVLLAPGAAPGLVRSEFFCPSISPSLDSWQCFLVGFVAVGSKTPRRASTSEHQFRSRHFPLMGAGKVAAGVVSLLFRLVVGPA